MERKSHFHSKRCVICGRFFKPDRRTVDRQKCCKRDSCRKKAKQISQERWLEKNPGHFNGHYKLYVKPWRKKNPSYQRDWRRKKREIKDEIPPVTPLFSMTLLIPEFLKRGEIKDEYRLVHQTGQRFWLTGMDTRDKRQDGTPSLDLVSCGHDSDG